MKTKDSSGTERVSANPEPRRGSSSFSANNPPADRSAANRGQTTQGPHGARPPRKPELLAPAGFGRISVTTAGQHDAMIAFTSQLAHVVSNAYIKSPTARVHRGFSAGSYKDMTRVAWLNPGMWAELFLENKDNLIAELDGLIDCLNAYKTAMEADDRETLVALLDEGKRLKEEVDGR